MVQNKRVWRCAFERKRCMHLLLFQAVNLKCVLFIWLNFSFKSDFVSHCTGAWSYMLPKYHCVYRKIPKFDVRKLCCNLPNK